jgi:hypothetical protein
MIFCTHHYDDLITLYETRTKKYFVPGDVVRYNRIIRQTFGVVISSDGLHSCVLWTEGPKTSLFNDMTERMQKETYDRFVSRTKC